MNVPTVIVTPFITTDDVVWTGQDGKPRCAKHPYICLVNVNALPLNLSELGLHVCAVCLREANPTKQAKEPNDQHP